MYILIYIHVYMLIQQYMYICSFNNRHHRFHFQTPSSRESYPLSCFDCLYLKSKRNSRILYMHTIIAIALNYKQCILLYTY